VESPENTATAVEWPEPAGALAPSSSRSAWRPRRPGAGPNAWSWGPGSA